MDRQTDSAIARIMFTALLRFATAEQVRREQSQQHAGQAPAAKADEPERGLGARPGEHGGECERAGLEIGADRERYGDGGVAGSADQRQWLAEADQRRRSRVLGDPL